MRWLYTVHLRAPGATVILVANKCDASLTGFAETTERVEILVKRELKNWQSRRHSNVISARLQDGVSRSSCVHDDGIARLVNRISQQDATSIQVPPAWDLALKVLDALRAGDDPLRAARAHLGLNVTTAAIGETIEIATKVFITKSQLLEMWEGIVRQVSEELQSEKDMTAVSNPRSALNGALCIRPG